MSFSNQQPTIYQRFIQTVKANSFMEINCYSRFITMLGNNSATDILISIGGQVEYPIPAGLSVDLSNIDPTTGQSSGGFFGLLRFRNTTGADIIIDFALSSGRIEDHRLIFIAGAILSIDSAGSLLSTPAKVTVPTTAPGAPLVAAAASTREVLIQNNGTNPLWIGDANVDGANARGICLPIGGSTIILNTKAAIYARATTGSTIASVMILGN